MNRKFTLVWTAIMLLGFSGAWAQDEDAELPGPAADEAREAAQLPDAAAEGLLTAAKAVRAEATIRLMDDADEENGGAVTHDVQLPILLPILPPEGEAGQQGLDTAVEAIAGRDSFGLDRAADARDNAADMAESAQSGVEALGRAEDRPVDVPGRPEVPTPPGQ